MSEISQKIRFLTRAGCGLCADAEPLVRAAALSRGIDMEVVDVDTDPGLRAEHGDRVPVVLTVDGRVLAEGRIESGRRLRRALGRV